MDAKRESDGLQVAIKWVPHAEHTREELNVMRFLSSDPLRSNPQNHCNPLLDAFSHPEDPNGIFIITPWLAGFVYVPILSVAEVIEMMMQLLEVRFNSKELRVTDRYQGLAFMHRHNVAHR